MGTNAARVWLTISGRAKAIFYPGTAQYEEGSSHYGFKPLKGRPEEAAAIPEVQDDPALRDVLIALNDKATGVFTVGCEKSFNHDTERGHWVTGYIEFAINDKELVNDAQNYFKMFFAFNRFVHDQEIDESIGFHWELEPTQFLDANISGYTATVWVMVWQQQSAEMVHELWAQALSLLTEVVSGIKPREGAVPIY